MPTRTINKSCLRTVGDGAQCSRNSSPSHVPLAYFEDHNPEGEDLLGTKRKSTDPVKDKETSKNDNFYTNVEDLSVSTSWAPFEETMRSQSKGPMALVPISPRKMNKRRSCALSQKMSPCIEKATFHLYQLQDKISGGTKLSSSTDISMDLALLSTAGYQRTASILQRKPAGRIQLKPLRKDSLDPILTDKDKPDTTVASQVLGTGYVIPNENDTALRDFAQSVIDEHLLLLGRLETDRYNTEQALIFERERVRKLRKKIDDLAYKRMCELPVAVQREHEACAYDIQELKWHMAQRQRMQVKTKEKLHQAEIAKKDLSDKIGHIEEHSPSVEQKLMMDKEDMAQIEIWQRDTDKQLADATEQLERMEKRYSDATNKADDEKDVLNAELSVIRENLDRIRLVLQECEAFHNNYIKKLESGRGKLEKDKEELDGIEKKLKDVIEEEKERQAEIANLEKSIDEQEREHRLLEADNARLENQRKEETYSLENENGKLELDNKKAVKDLRELVSTNRSTEREIREIRKAIVKWGKQQIENEKAVKRAAQETGKLQRELEIIEDETGTLRQKNERLNSNYNHFVENSQYQEETLKGTIDGLAKQLKDEIHARTVLQAKIAAESTEYVRVQGDAEKKRDKASKRAEEIAEIVKNLETQVDKLNKAHEDRRKVVSELENITDKVKQQHKQTEEKLTAKLSELHPKEEESQKELAGLHEVLKDMAWRTEAMEKKMADMASSSDMMNKVICTNEDSITELSEELAELRIQLECGKKVQNNIQESLKSVEERNSETCEEHEEHMSKRIAFLKEKEDELRDVLAVNNNLAKRYYVTQKLYLSIKHEFLRIYEKGLLSENNLRDQEGLCDLHYRLHNALECYYQLRGLQTKVGLAKFKHLNESNGERLGQIQSNMQSTIDKISRFLVSNEKSQEFIRLQSEQVTT